jgi:hypothetical protein
MVDTINEIARSYQITPHRTQPLSPIIRLLPIHKAHPPPNRLHRLILTDIEPLSMLNALSLFRMIIAIPLLTLLF